jgi:hypothetical protein
MAQNARSGALAGGLLSTPNANVVDYVDQNSLPQIDGINENGTHARSRV